MLEMTRAARQASLGATRQMIADDQFGALVAALVDCRAIPSNVMASLLDGIADQLIAKARGDLESGVVIYPSECFDRARELSAQAARLRS